MIGEIEFANDAVKSIINQAARSAISKIENLQMRLEKQVKLVERLTEELGEVQKERDEWRCKYEDLEGGSTDTSNFTSIGDAANNIVNNLTVHGFENDEGAGRIISNQRPIIERVIGRVVARAVEQERERIKREVEEMFGGRDT